MSTPLHIENLPESVVERLRSEARRRGVAVDQLAGQLLSNAVAELPKGPEGAAPRNVEQLAGTWTVDEVESFLARVACFARVDDALWQ